MSVINLERLKTPVGKRWVEKHKNMIVLIYSGQHGAYWRSGRAGYACSKQEAGRYTLADALDASGHAGPEKRIRYELVKESNDMKSLFLDITKWQRETFGQATTQSKLAHLSEEIIELNEAVQSGDPDRRLEYADCFFLLFGAAAADGMSYEDILSAIEEKFNINRTRVWGKPDQNGVVRHVEGAAE